MNKTIVTFGEIMVRLGAPAPLRLSQCTCLDMSFAGAEANVAVSLANYGMEVHYITRLPNNPIADKCLSDLRSMNVNTDKVLRGGNRMGLMYLESGSNFRPSHIYYDRINSALSQMHPGMVNWSKVFKDACWFHWTGITPALSQDVADTLKEAINIAKKMNITISCDINYRSNLWKYGKTASEVMPELVAMSDIILGNEEDFDRVFSIKPEGFNVENTNGDINSNIFESVCSRMKQRFPDSKKIIMSLRGAINANHNTWSGILYDGKQLFLSKRYNITNIVDRVGGGDSFMGGLIYGLLTYNNDNQKALEFAVAASALKHTIQGDFNRVSISEVKELMDGNDSGRVKR